MRIPGGELRPSLYASGSQKPWMSGPPSCNWGSALDFFAAALAVRNLTNFWQGGGHRPPRFLASPKSSPHGPAALRRLPLVAGGAEAGSLPCGHHRVGWSPRTQGRGEWTQVPGGERETAVGVARWSEAGESKGAEEFGPHLVRGPKPAADLSARGTNREFGPHSCCHLNKRAQLRRARATTRKMERSRGIPRSGGNRALTR
jgi:hypothetical protein